MNNPLKSISRLCLGFLTYKMGRVIVRTTGGSCESIHTKLRKYQVQINHVYQSGYVTISCHGNKNLYSERHNPFDTLMAWNPSSQSSRRPTRLAWEPHFTNKKIRSHRPKSIHTAKAWGPGLHPGVYSNNPKHRQKWGGFSL